jgi:tetratricopeptide (TPR) repeat protein
MAAANGAIPASATNGMPNFVHRFVPFTADQAPHQVPQQPAGSNPNCSSSSVDSSTAPANTANKTLHQKRCDLVESPTTKQNFKIFFRQFKLKEKQEGAQAAKDFANRYFDLLPEKIHWKIYLEMADLAKRENSVKEARMWYKRVNELQPYASQGWLEYAKMEEECGELSRCEEILRTGLQYCPYNEGLLVKGIKHWERMGELKTARSLLGRLKNVAVERAWRTIMEGGLLEARAGNSIIARKVFQYLMRNVPWYGPIYQEAFRFEEKCEEYERAISIVERGLRENPRYGPLWFSALRLYEKTANGNLDKTRQTVERAMRSISKELVWKIYFEAAQVEERASNLQLARTAYVQSVYHCPENLRWKVWLGGARMELNCDSLDTARSLLYRSLAEVPAKMKAMVLLECSRLEEYAGNLAEARSILAKARHETKHEWKVFLESTLLEMRANNIPGAVQEAKEALKIHTGTGRLWAVLIQLKQNEGEPEQMGVFQEALREVPKSGEVWCEGARIELTRGNLAEARKYLDFAIQFTPQYGDSFIEYLRLELIEKANDEAIRKLEQLCVNADPNYGAMWLHCKRHPLDSTRQVLRNARTLISYALDPTIELSNDAKSLINPNTIEMLSLNRMCNFPKNLSNEERRKIIFGSDQIKP